MTASAGLTSTSGLSTVLDFASCEALHRDAWTQPRQRAATVDWTALPANGVFRLFEEGEAAHGGERIVYAGTHQVEGALADRLHKHFAGTRRVSELRKLIGAALMRRDGAAEDDICGWESGAARFDWIEAYVTTHLAGACSFVVTPVCCGAQDRTRAVDAWLRLLLDCSACLPTDRWLGRFASLLTVASHGLWNIAD